MLGFTPFDLWARLAGALCVLSLVLWQIAHARRNRLMFIHEPTGIWTVQTADFRRLSGQLVKAGYRSARLLILTIQTDDGRLHRFPLWCDQLSGRDFSYLQQQLAFGCESPVRRPVSQHWHEQSHRSD